MVGINEVLTTEEFTEFNRTAVHCEAGTVKQTGQRAFIAHRKMGC
jgi:hypothetical protein